MGVIQDSEFIFYKSIAKHVKNGLVRPLNKLNAKCLKEFSKFENQKSLFLNCETYEDLGDNSKKLKSNLKNLISLLAVQNRLEKIASRNEQRIDYMSLKLQQMGIYNEAVDKKTISSALSAESKNVSENSLNLNPKTNRGVTLKFFNGQILAFRDNELDFGLEENSEILISGDADCIHSIVETFPYSVGTIPDEYYIYSELKNKILKECILYVASKIKTQSIAESNKQLGGLLERAGELASIAHFANELRNYFNVVVKQTLREQFPDFESEINSSLRCDETSLFLPKLRRVAVDVVLDQSEPEGEENLEKQTVDVDEAKEELGESGKSSEKELSTKDLIKLLTEDEDDLDETSGESFEPDETSEINSDSSEGSSDETDDSDIDDMLKELEELFDDDEDDSEDKKG